MPAGQYQGGQGVVPGSQRPRCGPGGLHGPAPGLAGQLRAPAARRVPGQRRAAQEAGPCTRALRGASRRQGTLHLLVLPTPRVWAACTAWHQALPGSHERQLRVLSLANDVLLKRRPVAPACSRHFSALPGLSGCLKLCTCTAQAGGPAPACSQGFFGAFRGSCTCTPVPSLHQISAPSRDRAKGAQSAPKHAPACSESEFLHVSVEPNPSDLEPACSVSAGSLARQRPRMASPMPSGRCCWPVPTFQDPRSKIQDARPAITQHPVLLTVQAPGSPARRRPRTASRAPSGQCCPRCCATPMQLVARRPRCVRPAALRVNRSVKGVSHAEVSDPGSQAPSMWQRQQARPSHADLLLVNESVPGCSSFSRASCAPGISEAAAMQSAVQCCAAPRQPAARRARRACAALLGRPQALCTLHGHCACSAATAHAAQVWERLHRVLALWRYREAGLGRCARCAGTVHACSRCACCAGAGAPGLGARAVGGQEDLPQAHPGRVQAGDAGRAGR